jgi:hypothetical protein
VRQGIIEHVTPAENNRICKLVRQALKDGVLVKPAACSWCGREDLPIHGHHPDYARPLMVVWICARCHSEHHAQYRIEWELMKDGF